jgi:hypothetical protein
MERAMSKLLKKPSAASLTAASTPTLVARRIRFVTSAPAAAKVRRVFQHPRPCIAIEEPLSQADLPAAKIWPEPTEQLDVVFLSKGSTALDAGWLASPEQPEAVLPTVFEWEGCTITWRPGRALVQGDCIAQEELLAGLIEFAFYEGELRRLEQEVAANEAETHADVALSYKIRWRDRKQWKRIHQKIEACSRLRLIYARLEPRLQKGTMNLPRGSRRVMNWLIRKADIEARLEATTERLEACEDLYEGASDRIVDYRGWFVGHILEFVIIALLLIEVLFFALDAYLRTVDL